MSFDTIWTFIRKEFVEASDFSIVTVFHSGYGTFAYFLLLTIYYIYVVLPAILSQSRKVFGNIILPLLIVVHSSNGTFTHFCLYTITFMYCNLTFYLSLSSPVKVCVCNKREERMAVGMVEAISKTEVYAIFVLKEHREKLKTCGIFIPT